MHNYKMSKKYYGIFIESNLFGNMSCFSESKANYAL